MISVHFHATGNPKPMSSKFLSVTLILKKRVSSISIKFLHVVIPYKTVRSFLSHQTAIWKLNGERSETLVTAWTDKHLYGFFFTSEAGNNCEGILNCHPQVKEKHKQLKLKN